MAGHSLTSESFGFDSVYSPLVKAAPRRKSKTEEGKAVKNTVPEVYPEQQHLINGYDNLKIIGIVKLIELIAIIIACSHSSIGSPTVLSPENISGSRGGVGNLANDYLRNEYITLDGSSGAEWIQV